MERGKTTSNPADGKRDRPVVAMFLRSTFQDDARVTREALSLVDEGFDVVVFASAAIDGSDAGETWEGPIRVVRFELDTIARRFVRLLAKVIGYYARALRLARRAVRRARGARIPIRTRGVAPGYDEAPGPLPPSVRALKDAQRRLWTLLGPVQSVLQVIRFGRLASGRAASLRPAAYHCHDMNAMYAGYRARRCHRAPLIYDAHELWPYRNRPGRRRSFSWISERADRYFAQTADAVITVNESIAQHMGRRYKLTRPVMVLRNIPVLTARAEIPPYARLPASSRLRLAYVGGLRPTRGLEEAIDALPMIPEADLIVMGPGRERYRDELRARAQALGVDDRVRFVDAVPIDAVSSAIAQCDIGLSLTQRGHLSHYLSLPNKIFEYMHAGLAILASDFPEMRRLVEDTGSGRLCDPGSPGDIAAAINEMLARPEELARMRDHALKASQSLNWERERERLATLYRRLVPRL